MNSVAPPTAFHARTGELTAPGMTAAARAKSAAEFFFSIILEIIAWAILKFMAWFFSLVVFRPANSNTRNRIVPRKLSATQRLPEPTSAIAENKSAAGCSPGHFLFDD